MRKRQNRQLEPCRRNPTTYIWKPLWAPPEVDPFHSGHFHETLLVAQPGQQICPQYPLPNPAIVLLNPPTHHAASRLCTPLASSVLSELTALSSPGGWSRYRCTMCEPGTLITLCLCVSIGTCAHVVALWSLASSVLHIPHTKPL